MALKAVLDSVSGLAEPIAKEYKQGDDGKFRLDVEAVGGYALENITGLKTSLQSERSRAEEASRALKAFEGLDASAAREAIKKLEEVRNWSPDQKVQEQIAASVKTVEQKYGKQLEEATGQLKQLESALSASMIDQATTASIAKHGGVAELLLPHVRNVTRLRKTDNGRYVVDVIDPASNTVRMSPKGTSTSNMTLEELVEEMKAHPVFGRAFPGSGASGGGSSSGGGGGGSQAFTMTESQARDIGAYRRMRAEAEKVGKQVTIIPG